MPDTKAKAWFLVKKITQEHWVEQLQQLSEPSPVGSVWSAVER